jgi:hypothetical protein
MHHSYKYDAKVVPLERKTQVAKPVSGELQASKSDGHAWGSPMPVRLFSLAMKVSFSE